MDVLRAAKHSSLSSILSPEGKNRHILTSQIVLQKHLSFCRRESILQWHGYLGCWHLRAVVALSVALLHTLIHIETPSSLPAEPSILQRLQKAPPSLSPSDSLTRSSISDTQLCHPEQSLASDRKASRLTAPRRLDGEARTVRGRGIVLVPEGFISCPDRLLFFQVGRWIFYL